MPVAVSAGPKVGVAARGPLLCDPWISPAVIEVDEGDTGELVDGRVRSEDIEDDPAIAQRLPLPELLLPLPLLALLLLLLAPAILGGLHLRGVVCWFACHVCLPCMAAGGCTVSLRMTEPLRLHCRVRASLCLGRGEIVPFRLPETPAWAGARSQRCAPWWWREPRHRPVERSGAGVMMRA